MDGKAKFDISPEVIQKAKTTGLKALYVVLIGVIAILSAYSTYHITMSNFNNVFTACMMTFVVEGCLTVFSILFHTKSKGYVFLFVAYLFYSIVASQGDVIGQIDTKQSKAYHESPEYKKWELDTAFIDSQITTLQKRIESLNASSPSGDNSSAINDLNNKIATKRTELRNTVKTPKTQRIRDDIQREIDSLERSKKEQLNISEQATQAKSDSSNESKSILDEIHNLNSKKDKLKTDLDNEVARLGIGVSAYNKALKAIGISDTSFWTIFFILMEISRFQLLKALKGNKYQEEHVSFFTKLKNTIMDSIKNKEASPLPSKVEDKVQEKEEKSSKSPIDFETLKLIEKMIDLKTKENKELENGKIANCVSDIKIETPGKIMNKIGFNFLEVSRINTSKDSEDITPNFTPEKEISRPNQEFHAQSDSFTPENSGSVENKDFQKNDSNFTTDDIKNYCKYVQLNRKGANKDQCPWYQEIADGIGIETEKARKIKAHLEQIGVLEVRGKRTYIVGDLEV